MQFDTIDDHFVPYAESYEDSTFIGENKRTKAFWFGHYSRCVRVEFCFHGIAKRTFSWLYFVTFCRPYANYLFDQNAELCYFC